ncbi:MAG TPA: hypothetical protein DCQ36_11060 [Actinobacteria bacterium]|nr:hypothetical protein [Actinomycetota bacterium]
MVSVTGDWAALTAAEVIERLGLEPLEGEGVWIRLLWRNDSGNAIYGMVTPTDFSALHRLAEDELWVHVAGASIDMLQLHPDGRSERVRLGRAEGEVLHALVPAGSWQGSSTSGDWALVVCALAPAFSGFELAGPDTDLTAWPTESARIQELIRG